MELLKISIFIIFAILIANLGGMPSDDEDDTKGRTSNEPTDKVEAATPENGTKDTEAKENECTQNESGDKQPVNETKNKSDENTDVEETDENKGNGKRKEQEADEASDSSSNFKDKVKDAFVGMADFINSIIGCRLHTPGFRQCFLSGKTKIFNKSEAGAQPIPTEPVEVFNTTADSRSYSLHDWVTFLKSKEEEKPSVAFAVVPVSTSESSADKE